MSQVLTVPTHFNDIGELSEGFLDRVEQDTLILYGPVAYEEGSEIEFALLLADGTTALEGSGRVRAAVDGGEDRMPETRYDVVMEDLNFDGRSEVVFERLVIARQAVSEPAPPDEPADDDAELSVEAVSLAPEELDAVALDESEPDTVPPEEDAYAEDEEAEEDSPTVIASVDAEAMMAEAELEDELAPDLTSEPDVEPVNVASADDGSIAPEPGVAPEPEAEVAASQVVDAVIATATETEIEFRDELGDGDEPSTSAEAAEEPLSEDRDGSPAHDSMYAFEHGIAAEPRVGMPVPMPSMAAPPEAPPAPPTLRLAEPPEGLTRPSFAQPDDGRAWSEGEVSDVHTTGLFAYENGIPIPARPPLPDPNRAKQVPTVEAANDVDVEDSEPPELLADDYEEVRLSDFAEAVEEG